MRSARRKGAPPTVALVGVPNCGKSLIFNRLTGKSSTSTNYPYTTSEVVEQSVNLHGRDVVLLDTPGITGLEFRAEEEAKTRELLRGNPPDIIVQCVDASHLVRSLILCAQLADLEIPMVVCLNMVDEASDKGLIVDREALSAQLGVPVVPICALDGRGLTDLSKAIAQARVPRPVVYPPHVEEKLRALTPATARATQVSVILDGEPHRNGQAGPRIWHMVLEAHHHWARSIGAKVTRTTGLGAGRSFWTRLADLALHPVGAWCFLLLTVALVYLLVVEVGARFLSVLIDGWVVVPLVERIASLTGPGHLHDVLVGPYGLLTLGLFNAIATVLPILAVFYVPFGVLEDVGYFPRLSVQFDRLFRWLGLNGNAVLPITLGFGCSAVATVAVRRLETRKERFIAAFLIALGVPCSGQIGVVVSILSTLPVLALVGTVAIVLVLQLCVGAFLARLFPKRAKGEFMVELPPLRAPRWKNIMLRTYHRLVEFITEAVPLFLASAATLLALHYLGLLDRLRDLLAPVVVSGLGLPRNYADALLVTLARRELGAVMLKKMSDDHLLSLEQTFVGLLVMILFLPCLTTTMAMGRVLGWRSAAGISIAVMAIATGAGAVVHLFWM